MSQLEIFLAKHKGKNFVKSHGQDTHRFIAKQGLDKTFYECDTHMWRLGDRTLPSGIRIDGGSDWVVLNREFCKYLIFGNDELLTGLNVVFKKTLLPAEVSLKEFQLLLDHKFISILFPSYSLTFTRFCKTVNSVIQSWIVI